MRVNSMAADSGVQRADYCAACGLPTTGRIIYGHCPDCYEIAIKTNGELSMVASYLSNEYERYEYEPYDTIFAHFYRTERAGEVYIVKTEERQWCLKLFYKDGYPCPPRLSFVNAYNHKDDNPLWWPKTTFIMDPVRKLMDLPFIAERSAVRGGLERGRVDNLKPKSGTWFSASRYAKKMTYPQYLTAFWEKRAQLEHGSNIEAHSILKKWNPDYYISVIAPRIIP